MKYFKLNFFEGTDILILLYKIIFHLEIIILSTKY